MKHKIYLNEYNIPTNNSFYLPYSSGLLQTYAQRFSTINDNYKFVKTFFQRDTVDNIVSQYDNPDVVGFSVSMWNYQLSLQVAKTLKKKFPKCTIIFGGPHITLNPQFFKDYPFVDFAVYREGERIFSKILLNQSIFDNVRHTTILYDESPPKDLDLFSSPYSNGIFTRLIQEHPELEFKAIVETNRNCPFNCAFCYWGSNEISNKIRYHSLDYIQKEFEWIAKNKIKYVFCADANFGMFKRDIDIAKICTKIKQKYNYPEKFRVCYGKNATQNIFNTAQILSKSNLAKTVTLSVQSFNQVVLNSINRKNIKTQMFEKLQKQYSEANIPTYTEIILGLPNETLKSFLQGLESTIRLTKDNQIFIYHCQVLPNTKLADLSYQKQYGIQTVRLPLAEVHVTARQHDFVTEFDEIIIKTNTMTTEEWIECTVVSWIVQLFHSLGIGNRIVDYLVEKYNIEYMDIYTWIAKSDNINSITKFWDIAKEIPLGQPRCKLDKQFGNIYYEIEELTYLQILCNQDRFYDALYDDLYNFLETNGLDKDPDMSSIFNEQTSSLPCPDDFNSLQDFATQTIIYGRKNNKTIPTQV